MKLVAVVLMLAVPPAPPGRVQNARIVSVWRFDSLTVHPRERDVSDSVRVVLDEFRRRLREANRQFATSETRITMEYRADSTYRHEVAQGRPLSRVFADSGSWTFDEKVRVLACTSQVRRHCPHHGAVLESLGESTMVLRLDMRGRGAGLVETFYLSRSGP